MEDKGDQTPALKQESAEQKRKALKVGLIIGAAAVFLVLIISTVRWLSRPRYSEVNIASKPPGARVYVDGQEMGISGSPLRIAVPRAGARLNFRLSLENHRDHTGVIDVKPNVTYSVGPFVLEEILQVSSELREMYEKAVQAYNDKNWFGPEGQNLLEYANQLLSMDPDNRNGVKAKAEGLLSGVKDEFLNQWQNLPKRDTGTERELDVLELLVKVDPENPNVKERLEIIRGEAERIKGEIRRAISKNSFFPPEEKNAWDLLNELDKHFRKRERPYRQSRLTEMATKVSSLAADKCKGSSPTNSQCLDFVKLALTYFPNDQAIRDLDDKSKVRKDAPAPTLPKGPDPIQTRVAELTSKMDAAFSKQCVVPENGSVVFYANEILKIDDSNRHALDLRGECRGLANSEAAQLSDREHSRTALSSPDEARKVKANLERATKIYQAIRSFWSDDLLAPTRLKDLSVRLELINKLLNTGDSFPVSHLHGIGALGILGRCDGDLTVNGYQIKYTPNKKKHNDIIIDYPDLKDIAPDGGKLGLTTVDRKSNKFKAEAEDEKQNAEQVKRIQNQMNELKTVRETLAGTRP